VEELRRPITRILRRIAVAIIVLSATAFLPRAAAADPVVITSGQVEAQPVSAFFRLIFEGHEFFLRAGGVAYSSTVGLECVPCVPGTIVDLGGSFNLPIASGAATVDGVTYPEIWVDGMTATFTTPSVIVAGSSVTTISALFTFSGTISGFLENPLTRPADVPPAFTKSVVGSGRATGTFVLSLDENPVFTATSLRYDFGQADPVPEPATMFLCAAGAAALAMRRRRRRSV
jgi:hypothetical protein